MKILKTIGIGLAVLIVLFFGIAIFLPSQVHVERSLVIPASTQIVFNQINDLRNWKNWSPWHQRDPNMEITYEGFLKGEGASYRWNSQEVGSGKLTITESHPHKYIATEMDFMKKGQATGFYRLEPVANGTKVTWVFETEMGSNPVDKYFGLLMDRMVGADFEVGLQNLRNHVKNLPSKMMSKDIPQTSN